MNTFLALIHILTFYMIFELYVKGLSMILVERYTDERAEVLGASYYRFQATLLILFCGSMLVDQFRILG